jgi:membrane-bound ClpP family serine protease
MSTNAIFALTSILALLGVCFLVYEVTRKKRRTWGLLERISTAAVTLGLLGFALDSFALAGAYARPLMSISGALIIGGIAGDLASSLWRKIAPPADMGSGAK